MGVLKIGRFLWFFGIVFKGLWEWCIFMCDVYIYIYRYNLGVEIDLMFIMGFVLILKYNSLRLNLNKLIVN